jgi:hypothetical protein
MSRFLRPYPRPANRVVREKRNIGQAKVFFLRRNKILICLNARISTQLKTRNITAGRLEPILALLQLKLILIAQIHPAVFLTEELLKKKSPFSFQSNSTEALLSRIISNTESWQCMQQQHHHQFRCTGLMDLHQAIQTMRTCTPSMLTGMTRSMRITLTGELFILLPNDTVPVTASG